jgi:hypothetical protein
MGKLESRQDDVLYEGAWLTVRAMRRRNGTMPSKEWLDNLDHRGKGQFLAAAQIMETTLSSGRPPAGRAEQVRRSNVGLWELRVTRAGGTPPHLRAFYLRRERTIWMATGITKQQNDLTNRDIQAADAIAAEWLSQGGRR